MGLALTRTASKAKLVAAGTAVQGSFRSFLRFGDPAEGGGGK